MAIIDESPLDAVKLEQSVSRAVDEVRATLKATLDVMGDRRGLNRARAGAGVLTPGELAAITGTAERQARGSARRPPAGLRHDTPPRDVMSEFSKPPRD